MLYQRVAVATRATAPAGARLRAEAVCFGQDQAISGGFFVSSLNGQDREKVVVISSTRAGSGQSWLVEAVATAAISIEVSLTTSVLCRTP